MPTKRQRIQITDTPVVYKKDDNGNVIYPRDEDGHTGGAYNIDARRLDEVPDDPQGTVTDLANENNISGSGALLAGGAAVVAAGAVKRRRSRKKTAAAMPKYVYARQSPEGTSYVFVPPPEAQRIGFGVVFLGMDDGSGAGIGEITAKANGLASQVDAALVDLANDVARRRFEPGPVAAEERGNVVPDAGASVKPGLFESTKYMTDEALRETIMDDFSRAEREEEVIDEREAYFIRTADANMRKAQYYDYGETPTERRRRLSTSGETAPELEPK